MNLMLKEEWLAGAEERLKAKLQYIEANSYAVEFGKKISCDIYVIATAMIYFHKFFMRERIEHYDHQLYACVCVYLAAKIRY